MSPREALIALNLIDHIGPVRLRWLLEHFGDAPAILRASRSALLGVDGVGAESAEAIASWESSVDLAAELKRMTEYGCTVLIQGDDAYPESLREIYDPPIVLFGLFVCYALSGYLMYAMRWIRKHRNHARPASE